MPLPQHLLGCPAIVILGLVAPLHGATNIIDATHGVGAGSFELGAYAQNSGNAGNYMRLGMGAATIGGWTVGGADGIDWVTFPSNPAANGSYSVDLAGASHINSMSFGSISTTIPTVIGETYLIAFSAYGGVEQHSGLLTAGNLNQTFVAGGNPTPETPWFEHFEFTFEAQGTSTVLTFASGDSYGFGPVIDDVSVTVIPEPVSAILAGLGLTVLPGRRRRAP